MIDLTPLDVRKKRGDFRSKIRGYDPEEVDAFLELVAERFEELVKENLSLSERVEHYGTQLQALEGREKAVQEALVSAQRLRDDMADQTQKDADLLKERARREAVILKAEAETEVNRRLGEAEGLLRERKWALEELEKNRRKFLKAFRSLLEREFEALEVEEARAPLEDMTLDLDLRGWTPAAEAEEEAEEGDVGRDDVGDEDRRDAGEPEPPPSREANGFATQVLEVPVPDELGDEDGPQVAEDGPQVADEGPDVADDGPEVVEDGSQVAEDGPEVAEAPEPRWLFSLLKREEGIIPEEEDAEEKGGEGA